MKANKFGKYQCPCCGYYTYDAPTGNTLQLCDVCCWEDDGVQQDDPDYSGGANHVSLKEAIANFKTFGASEPVFKDNVRPPLDNEQAD